MIFAAGVSLGIGLGVIATGLLAIPCVLAALWVANRNGARLTAALKDGGILISVGSPDAKE
ncbi:MAG: hypothetical protein KGR26_10860 [Cyanobacteria bacterium REEB65]|nr:hypothetical protein [Cyanobacteria bacterium REEB65]